MSQMCPQCSFDNPDDAQTCSNCNSALRRLLGENSLLSERYRVVSVLGCGAMGAVYLAEHQRLVNRRCAIKENRPDPLVNAEVAAHSREQFLAEANVLADLDHPGLPKVFDYFVENNREYLVMDYVDGEDLVSYLERTQQSLDETLVLAWADQLLDALEYLHNRHPQPVIHRDIKPANLRVNTQGKIKLVDFGLVKLLDLKNPATKMMVRGLGTPAYAPLEQFADSDTHTDARSDIYSLGATLYHLLTYLPPSAAHERLFNSASLIPPRELNAKLSPKTERVVLKAMEIYPDQRYQSAAEMRQALNASDNAPVVAAAAQPPRPEKPGRLPIPVWGLGILAIALLGLVVGGLYFWFFQDTSNAQDRFEPWAVLQGQPASTATDLVLQPLGDAPVQEVTLTPTTTAIPTAADTATPFFQPTATSTPPPQPTATTSTAANANAQTIPPASLSGTIAYPVFNGTDYDLYFGQADGSGTQLFRTHASQPAFSTDGTKIAFHSWLNPWGVVTMALPDGQEILIADYTEDQLPAWVSDNHEIIYLSRREGDRKSRLIKVGSTETGSRGVVLGEGEYPSSGANNQFIFRGWGLTGPGLRSATTSFDNLRPVTTVDGDTAPALSPDGEKVAFMSRRDGNWEIYVVNTDGTNPQRLTENPAEDGLPTWSPDGNALAFVSNRGGTWAIWAMTPTGQDQHQLFAMEGSPDGFVGANRHASRGWAEERISWTK